MKTQLLKVFIVALFASIGTISCSSDDSEQSQNPSPFVLDENNFQGIITEGNVVLDASKTYKLTGKLVVSAFAKLTIPAGTRIEGTNGTSYIAIAQGGQIFVNGTAENPVIMTSDKIEKAPGQWGGLVICGKAPINKGVTASAEVSDLTYGGTEPNDNSGVLRYLIVEYSGFAYNSEKEFNGISFFGVGSGTVVENIQVHAGADDGFEFFGGTVNTKNLVSTSNEDDAFDWTEGWTGTNENWYAKLGLGRGNRGIEADNNASNHLATPISNPTVSNLTLIGLGDQGSESQAVKLRVGTKGKFDNVVLSNFLVGFDVQHDESLEYIQTSELIATNVKFDGVATKSKGKNSSDQTIEATAIFTENQNATGAGNGVLMPTWAINWITN